MVDREVVTKWSSPLGLQERPLAAWEELVHLQNGLRCLQKLEAAPIILIPIHILQTIEVISSKYSSSNNNSRKVALLKGSKKMLKI